MSGARALVAVDGIDGSGKSQFAAALARAAADEGMPALVIRIDDFRRLQELEALERADPEGEAALYYDRYYDFAAVDRRLDAFLRGVEGDAPLAIVEGVLVLRVPALSTVPLIVLETGAEEARRRIEARDQAKGRSIVEINRRIDRRYFPAQARYRALFDPVGHASLVVDNGDWAAPRVVHRIPGRFPPAVERALDKVLKP